MEIHTLFSHRNETPHIRLNTRRCKACWECVSVCPKHALGKVNLPFHKHAHINQADKCKGCLRCIEVCPNGAITPLEKSDDNTAQ